MNCTIQALQLAMAVENDALPEWEKLEALTEAQSAQVTTTEFLHVYALLKADAVQVMEGGDQ